MIFSFPEEEILLRIITSNTDGVDVEAVDFLPKLGEEAACRALNLNLYAASQQVSWNTLLFV